MKNSISELDHFNINQIRSREEAAISDNFFITNDSSKGAILDSVFICLKFNT